MVPTASGIEEYALTAGIILSFVGFLVSAYMARRDIAEVFRRLGFGRRHLLYAAAVLVVFLFMEIYFVKPSQQLFFDDAIYQGMAQDLLLQGQAWMCDYGTPMGCISGEIYHEPIGTSFDIAAGFLLFGMSLGTTFMVGIAVTAAAVVLTFLAALVLFRDSTAAFFSGLLMALSPMVLSWAAPTTSDTHLLPYSVLAILCLGIFVRRKSMWTFSMLLLSVTLATYMKVNAFPLTVIVLVMYLLLEERNLVASARKAFVTLFENLLNTKFLLVVLFFVIAITPEFFYAFNETLNGNYGAVGGIQNTCTSPFSPGTVKGNFNLQNFEYNVCANVLFWFNAYQSQPGYPVTQPVFFTLLAVVGAGYLFFSDRNLFAGIMLWFITFFLMYTFFYAGSVLYGVDWRFQLALIAQVSMLGGYGCARVIGAFGSLADELRHHAHRHARQYGHVAAAAALVILLCISYSEYTALPAISIAPWNITQAYGARFYENMVFNSSYVIPSNCLVFTYDPTLYNINGRPAAQIGDLFPTSTYAGNKASYSCMVLDYGYWCHTPNNLCTAVFKDYNLTQIKLETDSQNQTYGFYYINGPKPQ